MKELESTAHKKIFCIGLPKTGTSSLLHAFRFLGYKVTRHNRQLLREFRRGETARLDRVISEHDAFQDLPYAYCFEYLYEHYADIGLFILTKRSSADRWIQSVDDYVRTKSLRHSHKELYGYYRPFGRETTYKAIYERHNEAVRAFFANHDAEDKLMEFCVDNGDGWEELCEFIGCQVPDDPFPHVNKADSRRSVGRRRANAAIEPFYRAYAALAK